MKHLACFRFLWFAGIAGCLQLSLNSFSAPGIQLTNGRIASTSCFLFLSPTQEQEAETKHHVTLTMDQRQYLGTATYLRHTEITNLTLLTIAQAMQADATQLLNVAVRFTNDIIEVPFDFLGKTEAERDEWRKVTLHTETSSSSRDAAVEEYRRTVWFDFRYRITARLCEYHAQHPEKFKYIGRDEEIAIEGFADFIAKDEVVAARVGGFQIHKGIIYDPWGEPLHFIKHRPPTNVVKARGLEHIVMRVPVDDAAECLNENEQLGVCKHSAKGYESAPHNCIYVDVFYESDWSRQRRLKTSEQSRPSGPVPK